MIAVNEAIEESYQRVLGKTQPALTVLLSIVVALTASSVPAVKHLSITPTEIEDTLIVIFAVILGKKAWTVPLRGNLSLQALIGITAFVGVLIPATVLFFTALTEFVIVGADHFPAAVSSLQVSPPNLYLGLIIGPLAETFVFQAWLQTRIGLIGAAALFFISHFTVSLTVLTFAISAGIVRLRTKSLLAVYLSHVSYNALLYVVTHSFAHRITILH